MVDGVPSLRYMVVNIRRHPAKGPLPTMAALTQQPLFSWKEVDRSPEIERFKALLGAPAQEKLLARLTRRRRGRRFAHSQEALWRALLAKELFGHHTLAELVRDLLRNPELRQACGFEKVEDVPTGDYVWSRFQERLGKHIERLFNRVDHVHHLERNHVCSIGRMRARVGMVFLVMLAQAAAAVAAGHPEALRRILRPAA